MSKRLKGFTLIELLIVVAIIAILAAIAVPNFLEAQTRAKVSRVRADLRSLATGIESYYVDNNQYPAHQTGNLSINSGLPTATTNARNITSFRIRDTANSNLMTLTTPVAYLTSYFVDPFADNKQAIFAYSRTLLGDGWITWSYGPDADEASGHAGNSAHGGDILLVTNAQSGLIVSETYYNTNQGATQSLQAVTYDPTNGTTSNGDVYRIKQ